MIAAGEAVRVEMPHLRVVDDAKWEAAHAHLRNAAAICLRRTGGQSWAKPASDIESPYLLSGLGQCALCGASMTVRASHGHCFICASYDQHAVSPATRVVRKDFPSVP